LRQVLAGPKQITQIGVLRERRKTMISPQGVRGGDPAKIPLKGTAGVSSEKAMDLLQREKIKGYREGEKPTAPGRKILPAPTGINKNGKEAMWRE